MKDAVGTRGLILNEHRFSGNAAARGAPVIHCLGGTCKPRPCRTIWPVTDRIFLI